MAQFELKMPKLGESITDATITKWLKQVGENIELDEAILEIATDKVDSEIPSPVEGVLIKQLFKEGDVVPVETTIALIETDPDAATVAEETTEKEADLSTASKPESAPGAEITVPSEKAKAPAVMAETIADGRFYSPLVKNIARKEGISSEELSAIPGSGKDNRLTRDDLLAYLKTRGQAPASPALPSASPAQAPVHKAPEVSVGTGDEIIEMDRMRKLIADHMVMSEATSVHITLFLEADLTRVVEWRNKNKDAFEKREGIKLTYTPVFIEAIAKALRDYPMVNISVDGHKIIKRKNINVGMAAALPNGNLIVPVIHNADSKNLTGLAREVNDLAKRARNNQLKPDEIQGGTFTLTNFGTVGAEAGTPIINQPQVAILGVGSIRKKPVVIETPHGDTIGIRQMMYLSLACDHRVVDGALGSQFMKRVAEYLEGFDPNQTV